MIGQNVLPLIHPDDAAHVAAEIEAALASAEGVRQVEFRMRHSDGSYRNLQAMGRRWMHEGEPYVLVNSRDITAQHEAQTSLARSNELLSKVFTVSSNLLSITTPENGTFLDVNDAWLDTLGYRREEVIGRTALELGIWGSPENRARVVGELTRAGELRGFRASAFTRDGVERHLVIDARLLEVAAQTRVLLSCQDITDVLLIERGSGNRRSSRPSVSSRAASRTTSTTSSRSSPATRNCSSAASRSFRRSRRTSITCSGPRSSEHA
jgi:PAS domain S-box-containing protein